MKVTRENAKWINAFDGGECFLYWNDLFVATDEYDSDGLRRCVKLKTGNIFYFGNGQGDREYVTPVDAEVIVHD